MANSAVTADGFQQGTIIYFDFGPPAEDGRDEGLLKEKHYAVVAQMSGLSRSAYPFLLVCGLTSTKPSKMAGWIEVPSSQKNGLSHTSYLDVKKIYPIQKERVQRVVGQLEWEKVQQMKQILVQLFDIRRENLAPETR